MERKDVFKDLRLFDRFDSEEFQPDSEIIETIKENEKDIAEGNLEVADLNDLEDFD